METIWTVNVDIESLHPTSKMPIDRWAPLVDLSNTPCPKARPSRTAPATQCLLSPTAGGGYTGSAVATPRLAIVYVHMYVCMPICTYVYAHALVFTCVRMHRCMHACMHACLHAFVHAFMPNFTLSMAWYTHMDMCTAKHVCTYVCMHARMTKCMHACNM